MSFRNLGHAVKIARGSNAVSAGTSDITGATFDLKQAGGPFLGFMAIAAFGTLTSSQVTSLTLETSDDNSSWSPIDGATQGPILDADSNKLLVIDCHRPPERYIRAIVDRGTANAVLDSLTYIAYNAASIPITDQGSTVATPTGGVDVLVLSEPAIGS